MRLMVVAWSSVVILCGAIMAHGQEILKTVHVERYVRLAQMEPLYAWPGVDLDSMARAIEALNASRAELVEISGMKYQPQQVEGIQAALYPTEYLEQMRILEGLRRELNLDSGLGELYLYHQHLIRTISAYQDYLDRLLPVLEKTAAAQRYKGLEFHSGRTSFAHFLDGIEFYETQARVSYALAQERWQCVLADEDGCEQPKYPKPDGSSILGFDPVVFDKAPAQITLELRAHDELKGEVNTIPWAVLSGASCFPPGQQTPYLLWRYPAANTVPIFRAEVVSDLLVHDHRLRDQSNGYERRLDGLGARGYLFQTQTTLYACPDAAFDTARLRTLSYAYDAISELSWPTESDKVPDNIRIYFEYAAEALLELKRQTYLSEPSIEAFLIPVITILRRTTDEELSLIFEAGDIAKLEQLFLTYKLKTADLSQDIMNLIFSNAAIGDYSDYAAWDYLDELLFTRNGPQILLGGNNPSIIQKRFPMVAKLRGGTSPRLVSYSDELAGGIPMPEMIDILIDGSVAENRLSRLRSRPYLYKPGEAEQ